MNLKLTTIFLVLISTNAFSASSAVLKLVGVVPKKLDIGIDVSTAALDLSVNKVDFKIATITEKSNSNNGYKILITSLNLGNLVRVSGNEKFSYGIKYGGAAANLTSAAGQSFSNSSSGAVTASKDVLISYTGVAAQSMLEGSYEDTITFAISAN
jgi:hypothetical protein